MVFLGNMDWNSNSNNNVRHNHDIPLHKDGSNRHELERMSDMFTTNKRFNESICNKYNRIQKLK